MSSGPFGAGLRPLGLLAALLIGGSWFAWLPWRHPNLLSYLLGQEVVGRVPRPT